VQISDCGERRTAHDTGSRQAWHRSGLELEITETVLITDTEAVLTVLRQPRDLDAGIAMDDFGTGYSSLNYLRRFPLSKVEIDQSFIRALALIGTTPRSSRRLLTLARPWTVNLAEGVETEEQSGSCRTEAAVKRGDCYSACRARPPRWLQCVEG
jgi:EAL domain-containing protein (putative c-di-GMP-specific phosphodiesterase class I)